MECHKQTGLLGDPIVAKPVDECVDMEEVFLESYTCFGGGVVRDIYGILKEVLRKKVPLVVAVAGPITVSDQHRAWLIPLLKSGHVACVTTTDAACYHDGHDCLSETERRKIRKANNHCSLSATKERVIRKANLYGDDARLLNEGVIRITDTGFDEKILFAQDAAITEVLSRPEFQKKMTTTERNYLLGKYYSEQEKKFRVSPGLLSTCYELEIPVFVGAPADGSAFLNSVKLQEQAKESGKEYKFDINLHEDVLEFCAYHYWGLFDSEAKSLAILILGGGVPKNYSLQPEPCLSQIFKLDNIRGYDYDVQIVSAPEIEGSLTGCRPSEAVSWGKVNPATYQKQTASLQADYTTIINPLMYALLKSTEKKDQYRLYGKRVSLVTTLKGSIRKARIATAVKKAEESGAYEAVEGQTGDVLKRALEEHAAE